MRTAMRWVRIFTAAPVVVALLLTWAWAVAIDVVCSMVMRGVGSFIEWDFR